MNHHSIHHARTGAHKSKLFGELGYWMF